MSRPPLEVADLVRTAGEAFIERKRQWIRWKHVKVLRAIVAWTFSSLALDLSRKVHRRNSLPGVMSSATSLCGKHSNFIVIIVPGITKN